MVDDLPEIDVEFIDDESATDPGHRVQPAKTGVLPYLVVATLALLAGWWLLAGANAGDEVTEPTGTSELDPTEAVRVAQGVPASLLAAELYVSDPTADNLRDLLASIGGFDGVTVATAQGAFDLVGFDPQDHNRLLAVRRSSYGDAQNQSVNEEWIVRAGEVEQTVWAPGTEHDFAHFNVDGSITRWVHGGGPGFAPRRAEILPGEPTQPVYASRFTAANGTVFALTGSGEYSADDKIYVDLVAARGDTETVLAPGADYRWIDNPSPELLVAYPTTSEGVTAVWDTAGPQRLEDHPLAGLRYQRLAVSGDGERALGVTFGGELEEIDLNAGAIVSRFGRLNPESIDRPITLNEDGSLAITVDSSGPVTIWWVGDDTPIASVTAAANPLRWVSENYAADSSSAVAFNASRVALKVEAQPGVPVSWTIVETDPGSWIRVACDLAGRQLEATEREALGLAGAPAACP